MQMHYFAPNLWILYYIKILQTCRYSPHAHLGKFSSIGFITEFF